MQFVKVGQGCFAVMGHRDRVALLDQVKTQQFADIFIVIDNEDLSFAIMIPSFRRGSHATPVYYYSIAQNYGQRKNRI